MALIPEKGINYAVYLDGVMKLGVAEVELPNFEAMTSEVKGAGILGTRNTPVLAHFNDPKVSITWRNVNDDFFKLMPQKELNLTCYEAQQGYDTTAGEFQVGSLKLFIRGIPVSSNLGKAAVGELMDTQTELSLSYIKVSLDDTVRVEFDPYNYIYIVDGVDYAADIRKALGMN